MAKIARFSSTDGVRYGLVEDGVVYGLKGQNPFGTLEKGDAMGEFKDLLIAPPIQPSKILAVGRNYVAHAAEMGNQVPEEPMIFLKAPSALIGYDIPIVLPEEVGRVDMEGELAVVIRDRCRNIPAAEAFEFVLGYTCANDVTARELQKQDQHWWRAKGFDTFCPLGPWIETDIPDPDNLALKSRVSDETVQDSNTTHMIFSVAQVIAFISNVMTLLPGDVILTGTPAGVSELLDGDVAEVEIESIGTLRNPVESEGDNKELPSI